MFGNIQHSNTIIRLNQPVFGNITRLDIDEFESTDCIYLRKAFLYKVVSYGTKHGFVDTDVPSTTLDISMLHYINNNWNQEITLQQLGDVFAYSPRYIAKYFCYTLGTTLNEYLTNIRLAHAIKEVQETSKSISQIAYDNGFGSIRNFNRVFVHKYNASPKQIRQSLCSNIFSNQ
jgi:AraC-like DNA-binding protein